MCLMTDIRSRWVTPMVRIGIEVDVLYHKPDRQESKYHHPLLIILEMNDIEVDDLKNTLQSQAE